MSVKRYPRNRDTITRRQNHIAAFTKAATAPLHTLDMAMLESIAASHARRGTRDFDQLLERLRSTVAERGERERA